jgi:hypothetical protein
MHNKNSLAVTVKRTRLVYAQWLEHFSAWTASGQTQQAYCLSQNLSLQAFKKHYARHRRHQNENKITPPLDPLFIAVKLTRPVETERIEFIFRSGVILKIPASVSLKSMLKSLEHYL